jgi:hypothetical protein
MCHGNTGARVATLREPCQVNLWWRVAAVASIRHAEPTDSEPAHGD